MNLIASPTVSCVQSPARASCMIGNAPDKVWMKVLRVLLPLQEPEQDPRPEQRAAQAGDCDKELPGHKTADDPPHGLQRAVAHSHTESSAEIGMRKVDALLSGNGHGQCSYGGVQSLGPVGAGN